MTSGAPLCFFPANTNRAATFRLFRILIIGCFFFSLPVAAQWEPLHEEKLVSSLINRFTDGVNPGIVIGLVDETGPRYFSFGVKTKNGRRVDEHTVFEIGSVTKVFTATLLAQNIIGGKMKPDDPVSRYLPDSVIAPTWEGKPVALATLADHTSGLPRLPANLVPHDMTNPYTGYTADRMLDFLSSYALNRAPGSRYEYSNYAPGLLGYILGAHAGTGYAELVKSGILVPLGMSTSGFRLNRTMKNNLAPGHSQGNIVSNWDFDALAGAGALRSTVADMAKFISANLGLTPSPLKEAFELTHKARHRQDGFSVGLGWHITKGSEGDIIWHNGSTGGYRAFVGFVKETGHGVVILTNSDQSLDDVGFYLLDPASPVRYYEPEPKEK